MPGQVTNANLQTSPPTAADFKFVLVRANDGRATIELQQRTVTTNPNGSTTTTWQTAKTAGGTAVSQSNAGWDDTIPWAAGNYKLTYHDSVFAGASSWDLSPNPEDRRGIMLHQGSQADPSAPLRGCIGATKAFLDNASAVLSAAGVLNSAIDLDVQGNFPVGFAITRSTDSVNEGSTASFTISLTGTGGSNGVTKDVWVKLNLDAIGPGFATYGKDGTVGDFTIVPATQNFGAVSIIESDVSTIVARYDKGVYVKIPAGAASVTYNVIARTDEITTPKELDETINLQISDYFVQYKYNGKEYPYSDTITQPGVLLNAGLPGTTIRVIDKGLLTSDRQSGGVAGFSYTYSILPGDKINWSFEAYSIPDSLSLSDGGIVYGTKGDVSGARSDSFIAKSNELVVIVKGSASGTAWTLDLAATRANPPASSPSNAPEQLPSLTAPAAAEPVSQNIAPVSGATLIPITSIAVTVPTGGPAVTAFDLKANVTYFVRISGEGSGPSALANANLKIFNQGDAVASIDVRDSDLGGAPATFVRATADTTIRLEVGSDIAGRGGSATIELFDAAAFSAPIVFIRSTQMLSGVEGDGLPISVTVVRVGDVSQAATHTLGIAGTGAKPISSADLQGGFADSVVRFAAGQSVATVTLIPTVDQSNEGVETGIVFLRPESLAPQSVLNAQLLGLSTQAAISVSDGEVINGLTQPTISVSPLSTSEGGSLNFRVTLSQAATQSISVGYSTVDRTAISGTDFTPVAGTLVFAPGEIEKIVSVRTLIDTINESSETFDFNLVAPVGAYFANRSTLLAVTGTIENIQAFVGTSGNETLTGNDNPNVIDAGGGDDTLRGLGGNDWLFGNIGNDILTGGLGSDTLTGGPGSDSFLDTAANLNGDTITDFETADRIVVTDATLASFSFSLSGATLSFTGGSLTFSSPPEGIWSARAATGGGVELTLRPRLIVNDLNRDGRSDMLWRNDNGALTTWSGRADGGFTPNGGGTPVSVSWRLIGTGDFNGDGYGDVLWRNDNGTLTNWLGGASGFRNNDAIAQVMVRNDWKVVATADFNGDGRADLLWRNDNGQLLNWLATAAGGFIDNSPASTRTVGNGWKIVGTGDYNGDGRADVLWRNDNGQLLNWLSTGTGGFLDNSTFSQRAVPTNWKVVGTGDFDGDGRSDILWRNDSGQLLNWLGTATGGFTDNSVNSQRTVPVEWKVAGVGDYNGDGRSDILWRHDDGRTLDWLGTGTGGFNDNTAASAIAVPLDWDAVPVGSAPVARVQADFNGDGRSDILWRNDNGLFGTWLGNSSGGFTNNTAASLTNVATSWKIAGTGDFNGDGRADILWRNADGTIGNWLGNINGGHSYNAVSLTSVAVAWKVAGVGDFDGDGRSDILWRNDDGQVGNWLGTTSGGFNTNAAISLPSVAPSWKVAGIGDFNGDGRDDILWHNVDGQLGNWLSNISGGFAYNTLSAATVPTAWAVAGVGDFNGDGRDDILWRDVNGALSQWLARMDGGFTDNRSAVAATVPTSWKVAAIGDYNGDGRDDILWRNDNGAMTSWLGRLDGSFAAIDPSAFASVSTDWQIQPRIDVIV